MDDNAGQGHTGWICTYNVYDDFGMLRYQIQPEAVKWLEQNSWSFAGANGAIISVNYCFVYEYDSKGRNILKRAPGAAALYMVYDYRDRLVFMQDGNQRALSTPDWTVNLYDGLDRVVMTLLYHTTSTREQLQASVDNMANNVFVYDPIANQMDAPDNIAVNNRNPSIPEYIARQSIELSPGFESTSGDEFIAYTNPQAMLPFNVELPNDIFTTYPLPASTLNNASLTTILKYNFYDDYRFECVALFNNNYQNNLAYGTGSGAETIAASKRTLSALTGSKVRVLGTTTFLTNTLYYDEKGRLIQTTEENIKGGTDVLTAQYGFDGRPMSTHTIHSAANTSYTSYNIITKNNFDKLGRVTGIEKKFGTNAFKLVSKYSFDDMGRLKQKRLDPGYTGTGRQELEMLKYSYNIHGELTGINKDYALKTTGVYGKWDNFFGMYLGYDNADNMFLQRQVDGHVAGIIWNTQGDDAQRKYDYSYDNAGRLTKAAFTQKQQPGDSWSNTNMDLTVSGYNGKIEYDLNGNILSMLHKGVLPGNATPITIDDLRYTYAGNKLMKVDDLGNAGANNGKFGDFKDGSNGTDNDYEYDANGNLVIDLNKNVQPGTGNTPGIKYNYLDKPEEIKITGKGTIKIVYDAEGNKLQRLFTPEGTSTTTTTTYINEFVYKEDVLQFINFEEGRLRVMTPVSQNNGYDYLTIAGNADMEDNKKGAYDFFIRDYQGNVRMILTEETHTGSNICTMETNRAVNEEPVFGQTDASGNPTGANEVQARFAVNNIPGQSGGTGWNNINIGSYVSRVGALAASKVGPNTLLKVMAGDKVSATTIYFYKNAVTNSSGSNTVLNSVLAGLTTALSGNAPTDPLVHGAASGIGTNLSTSMPLSTATAPDASNANGTNPKAYLTVLFFDERFNFVGEGSTTQRVQQAGDNAPPLVIANVKAPKNGYAYIYVSNESDEHVYFDNLQVVHERGRIVEENHYYSYGLRISAISSRKVADLNEGGIKNNYQYQGDFNEYDEDIQWNDFTLRNYDPQTGRWVQQDPYQEFASPYVGMGNEPILNIDPSGGSVGGILSQVLGKGTAINIIATTLIGGFIGGIIDGAHRGEGVKGFIKGAAVGLVVGLSLSMDEIGKVVLSSVIGVGNASLGLVNNANQTKAPTYNNRTTDVSSISSNGRNDISNESEIIVGGGEVKGNDIDYYGSKNRIKYFKKNIRTSIEHQVGEKECFATILGYINEEMCNGSLSIHDYENKFEANYPKDKKPEKGVDGDKIEPFVKSNFSTGKFLTFTDAIDNGHPVMVIIHYYKEEWHQILIVGYQEITKKRKTTTILYYMDPWVGEIQSIDLNYFVYKIPLVILGCLP